MRIQSYINGMLTGIVIGMLFAPTSGAETRRRITSKANNLKRTVVDTYDNVSGTVSNTIDKVKTTANSILDESDRIYNSDTPTTTTGPSYNTDVTV